MFQLTLSSLFFVGHHLRGAYPDGLSVCPDEWEWLSALVEFINQTLLLEFEKSVISEPF